MRSPFWRKLSDGVIFDFEIFGREKDHHGSSAAEASRILGLFSGRMQVYNYT